MLSNYNLENQALWHELNNVYIALTKRAKQLNELITNEGFDSSLGFFNGHFVRTADNDFVEEHFPIPVITINNLYNIEIGLKYTTITSKLSRNDALNFPFEQGLQVPFEAYGVEDFQTDFYYQGMSFEKFRKKIKASNESEVFFTFFFDKETEPGQIHTFILSLKEQGFFY
jgi:hypothetical protein